MKNWSILILTALLVVGVGMFRVDHVGAAAALPAFPGAMGGGTLTTGGRGGQIIEITNANDSGAGSYRACVTASGPRMCVCRAGGVVPIRSDVTASQPFLTLDLQTCPGGGLILGDGQINGRPLNITTHDVVVRYVTLWMNNPNIPSGPDTGTTGIEIGTGAYNVVLDHVSCGAAGNKCVISYTSTATQAAIIHDVTIQDSMIGLPNGGHPVGPMTDGIAFAYLSINQDFHHNYFPWIGHRIALANMNQTHWVNNLTYNWCDPSASYGFALFPQGPSQNDFIGNIWMPGNMNKGCSNPHPININATGSSDCSVSCWGSLTQPSDYLSGNVCAQGTDWNCATQAKTEGGPETGPVPAAWQRTTPLPAEPNPIIADPVTGLETKILATVGNSQGVDCNGNFFLRRNSIDSMLIASYPNGNGQLFNQQFAAPTAAAGTACAEDPMTHVPVAYLTARGIPAGTSPWTVWKGDVYPIIETYGNGTGSTPPPTPPAVNCAPNPVAPGGNSSCSANQQIATWKSTAGSITPSGVLTAPMTPSMVTVTGTNPNGSGQAPVTVATPGVWTGWLGADALPGAAVGAQVTVGATAGPLRQSPCTVAGGAPGAAVAGAPSMVGLKVTILPGPPAPSPVCSPSNVAFWQVTTSATPPPTPPTVTCVPASIQVGGQSACSSNQPITTWSASAGTITAAGLYTAPATAQTVTIKGTNANGSGTAPITITANPPTTVYPPVSFTIGAAPGPITTVKCTANQSTGAYACAQQ